MKVMYLSFSIVDDPIVVSSPWCWSRSIVEGQFSMMEAQILIGGRVILHSGTRNLKNSRWIKGKMPIHKMLIIFLRTFSLEKLLEDLFLPRFARETFLLISFSIADQITFSATVLHMLRFDHSSHFVDSKNQAWPTLL